MNQNMPVINFKLPQPDLNLEADIWASLELEHERQFKSSWMIWKNWVFGSLATILVVTLITAKLIINQTYRNQFNDLDNQLAIAEQTSSLDSINLEWDLNSPESN